MEIEIKFFLRDNQVVESIQHLLHKIAPTSQIDEYELKNVYYDTFDGLLCHQGAALRLREKNDRYEMTIKSGGESIGGFHQRHEYNVLLDEPQLNLAKFPVGVTQGIVGLDVNEKAIKAIFSTCFTRKAWRFSYHSSVFEIALDQGFVQAGELNEGINELEIELLSGNKEDLFSLAEHFIQQEGLRLGSQSKAEKGYQLVQIIPRQTASLTLLKINDETDLKEGILYVLQYILSYWQKQEEISLVTNDLHYIRSAIMFAEQFLVLWEQYIVNGVSSTLQERLRELYLFVKITKESSDAIYHSSYLAAYFSILVLAADTTWITALSVQQQSELKQPFKKWCAKALSENWSMLKMLFACDMTLVQYQKKSELLQHFITRFHLLSGNYVEQSALFIKKLNELAEAVKQNETKETLANLRYNAMVQVPYWK